MCFAEWTSPPAPFTLPPMPLLVALFFALALGCRRGHAQETPPRRPVAPRVTPAPAPPRDEPRPAWTAAFRMRHRPVEGHDLHDVVVHAPPGFDPRAPLHLVLFFHGIYSHAAWWVVAGALAPVTGEPGPGWGLSQQHDRAHVNALLVAPQLKPRGTAGFSGAFHRPGFLRDFLRELVEETLAGRLGGRTLDDVASITLVGASAGGPLIAGLLSKGDLADRVRNVVVVDGLYGGEASFASWLRGSTREAPRRFVCVHAGSRYTAPHARDLVARLRAQGADVADGPRGALSDAVRDHRAVFATAPCEHVGMSAAVYDKVVGALGLPPREPGPGDVPRVPVRAPVDPVGALAWGGVARGTFAPGGARLRDWTYFDDWTLDLAAGQRARVEVRGGRTRSVRCMRHDVEVEVLDGDRSLALDDDGAGGLSARVDFTAPHAGRYTVRVMEHDAWAVEGEYAVRVGDVN